VTERTAGEYTSIISSLNIAIGMENEV